MPRYSYNENNYNWRPDMIRFNSYTSYGTLRTTCSSFPEQCRKTECEVTEENNQLLRSGAIGLSTWGTSATFDNVKVTAGDGR